MPNNICVNCGGWEGIHHYETMQCPLNGCEAVYGHEQQYQSTTYQEMDYQREVEQIKEQLDEIRVIKAQIKAILEAYPMAKNVMDE